ncbi:MAG: winged helix-turn-helix transcriptional regulator [Thaumarchaeota archaeon]|jgi:predicted transcriptional regulator|nr:winged helix-turn-helix transcriptional regulator [Candidatus Geocrenenecus arthurdayi]
MSEEAESITSKKKIELPRALREIVKILAEEGVMTYEELAEKTQKDLSTVVRQCQRLEELEIIEKVQKDNKNAVKLKEDIEVDEEGSVYVPSLIEEPIDKLRRILQEAGIKGKKLNFVLTLIESNPRSLEEPNELYDTLVAVGIRRLLAQQIVKAFFGTEFAPQQMQMPMMPRYGYGYNPAYPYPPPYPFMASQSPRLEILMERLLEEIKELKNSKPQSSPYPTVKKVKVDEQGKPIEVIEEPAFLARSDDSSKEMWKLMFEIREKEFSTIQTIVKETREMIKDVVEKLSQQMQEIDKKRSEELNRLREEIHKKELEYQRQIYTKEIEDLKDAIEGIKKHYEDRTMHLLEDLKKEWEYRLKLMELEQSKGLRDVIVGEIKETAKELRESTKEIRETFTEYMKQTLRQAKPEAKQVPQVSEEEKRRILEALRKKAEEQEKPKETAPETPKPESPKLEVKLNVVEGEKK